MADKNRHDINDFYFVRGKKEAGPDPEPFNDNSEEESVVEKAPDPEYSITSLTIIEPDSGFQINKPFDISGEVENLHLHAIKRKKILLYPAGVYKEKEDIFVPGGIEVFIDKNFKFRGICKYLFEPQAYVDDREKTEDAEWELYCTAEGTTAKETYKSESVRPLDIVPFLVEKHNISYSKPLLVSHACA